MPSSMRPTHDGSGVCVVERAGSRSVASAEREGDRHAEQHACRPRQPTKKIDQVEVAERRRAAGAQQPASAATATRPAPAPRASCRQAAARDQPQQRDDEHQQRRPIGDGRGAARCSVISSAGVVIGHLVGGVFEGRMQRSAAGSRRTMHSAERLEQRAPRGRAALHEGGHAACARRAAARPPRRASPATGTGSTASSSDQIERLVQARSARPRRRAGRRSRPAPARPPALGQPRQPAVEPVRRLRAGDVSSGVDGGLAWRASGRGRGVRSTAQASLPAYFSSMRPRLVAELVLPFGVEAGLLAAWRGTAPGRPR